MFERTLKIIDDDLFKTIQKQNIFLIGIGGVGGYALESLIRLGFQSITLVDNDKIEETNLNRQIISHTKNLGKLKTKEAKKRALEINPNIRIKTHSLFLTKENIDAIFDIHYDYIIDACDTITTKILLIKKALENQSKIITCLGTGNRINPCEITITTLNKTYNDPLAKAMRNLLKKENLPLNLPVIWSKELPIKTKSREVGSIALVPAIAGIYAVYFILEDLKKKTI